MLVQKKKPKKDGNCWIIGVSSHISGVLINQKRDSMVNIDVHLSQLNPWHEMYSLHNMTRLI